MKFALNTFLTAVAISVAIYFAIALGLILSQGGGGAPMQGGLAFDKAPRAGEAGGAALSYASRDGRKHPYRRFAAARSGVPLIVLIHGSGWHGAAYLPLAAAISSAGLADVVVPDLRGHGFSPQRRGDIDYLGQLEDDLADLIRIVRKPGQKLVLAGHSSGGGLVVRFAGGQYGSMLDGAILLAPFLKYNAPTARPNSGGWAMPLTRRIIGLSMLNAVGVTALNGLTVIRFAIPAAVRAGPGGEGATDAYSFRLNTSLAPRRDYLSDIAALPPFLLLAGADDEAFFAGRYEEVMAPANAGGRYELPEGVSHLQIYDPAHALGPIERYLHSRFDAAEAGESDFRGNRR